MRTPRSFILRLLVFSLPLAVVVGFLLWMGNYSGDGDSIESVVRQQMSATPSVYMPFDRLYTYKFTAAKMRAPQLLVFGSSRMWSFESTLADRNPGAFYNACIPGSTPNIAINLLTSMEPKLPQVLIWGLDPKWFNPAV